ncbi:MAG: flagellin [Porcipelethomonas sp.]
MGISIRTNSSANKSCLNLKRNSKKNSSVLEKLASGYKINRAADDASGLGITEKMRAQITALDTYYDNSENGISLIQTAEGAMAEISDMLQRGVELSERAANGIFTDTEREIIQTEIDELCSEIDRVSDTANFNHLLLLKGKTGVSRAVEKSPPKIVGGLPSWATIDTLSAASGTLGDKYVDSTGTHWAAYLDFSAFNPADIQASVNTGFYTTCCTCDNHYSIRFTADTTSSVEQSGRHYIYNVGIGNAKTADDVYDAIISATNGQPNNHYTKITKDNGKLVIYDYRTYVNPSKSSSRGLFGEGVAIDGELTPISIPPCISINAGEDRPGKILIGLPDISSNVLGVSTASVLTTDDAADAMQSFRDAIDYVSLNRANLGAYQNRLEHTIEDLSTASENVSAAKSRIKDTDMAKMMMEYTQNNVLIQAAQAMLAQANTQPQSVLQLIQ